MNPIHFKLGSELTFKSIVEVRSKLGKVLKNSSRAGLTLDLSEVTHCDSAGVALLIEAKKLCTADNRVLEIIGVPSKAQSLVEFYGVARILKTV